MKIEVFDSFYPQRAYIYIWWSRVANCAYVGQTSGPAGVIGRASSHLSREGTLRCRLQEKFGLGPEEFGDWVLFWSPLPESSEYTSAETFFRLAVEYRVQTKLRTACAKLDKPFKIISRITYTDACNYAEIEEISASIATSFLEMIEAG